MRQEVVLTMRIRSSVRLVTFLVVLAVAGLAVGVESQTGGQDRRVSELLTLLRDEQLRTSEPKRVIEAIDRLGEMKAIEAIDDLIELLTFEKIFEWEKNIPRDFHVDLIGIDLLDRYPATVALFRIGKPALPALLKVIERSEVGTLENNLAIRTVMMTFGDDPKNGVTFFREAAERTLSPDKARRLLEAAARLEGWSR